MILVWQVTRKISARRTGQVFTDLPVVPIGRNCVSNCSCAQSKSFAVRRGVQSEACHTISGSEFGDGMVGHVAYLLFPPTIPASAHHTLTPGQLVQPRLERRLRAGRAAHHASTSRRRPIWRIVRCCTAADNGRSSAENNAPPDFVSGPALTVFAEWLRLRICHSRDHVAKAPMMMPVGVGSRIPACRDAYG